MTKSIQNVRDRLKLAGQKKFGIRSVTGCCKIFVDGSTSRKSGITKQQCQDIANDFPGATFTFTTGVTCS